MSALTRVKELFIDKDGLMTVPLYAIISVLIGFLTITLR